MHRSGRLAALAALAFSSAATAQHADHSPTSTDALHGHAMIDDPLNKLVLVDRLEIGDDASGRTLRWDIDTWIGRELNKVWLRSNGARSDGDTERAEVEALFGHAFAPWWDLLAGIRRDFAPGDERTFAAVGVRGQLPFRFEIEATAYLGNGGHSTMRVETHYDVLVTNRLILSPQLEVQWHGRTDLARVRGAGLADAELALRLRYELRREIAPYVGIVRERHHGRTAAQLESVGRETEDTRWVAGVRLSF